MKDVLKILRYNTGTDKKAFVEFKDQFDAVIFNAAIVAYSGSSVADLVSMHKRKYIIDPQTHIFQQDISAIMAENKRTKKRYIKKSVEKYLKQLPEALTNVLTQENRPLCSDEIIPHIDALVNDSYAFQVEYVSKFIENKEYDKYLKFANSNPEPRLVIAPYFMLKSSYDHTTIDRWLNLNSVCLEKTIQLSSKSDKQFPIAAQIVLEKDILLLNQIIDQLKSTYSIPGFEYVFIWMDDYDAFESKEEYNKAFFEFIATLNNMGKKPIMAYGGYESILLCNKSSPSRLYGVAQSVGYGEYRPITPVGGGLPVNKYYFLPIHRRMRFDDAANILNIHGYFSDDKSNAEHAEDYYSCICHCKQCRDVIKRDINNFDKYNDSKPFEIKTRNGVISRNRPTTDASLIAAIHFLYCKVDEWKRVTEKDFKVLVSELKNNCQMYNPQTYRQINAWCKVYGCKED